MALDTPKVYFAEIRRQLKSINKTYKNHYLFEAPAMHFGGLAIFEKLKGNIPTEAKEAVRRMEKCTDDFEYLIRVERALNERLAKEGETAEVDLVHSLHARFRRILDGFREVTLPQAVLRDEDGFVPQDRWQDVVRLQKDYREATGNRISALTMYTIWSLYSCNEFQNDWFYNYGVEGERKGDVALVLRVVEHYTAVVKPE